MVKRDVELKKELDSLKEEELDYQFIKDFRCQTEEEFESFKQSNLNSFKRIKYIKKRLREIELELMSDDEKKEYLKNLQDLKNKFTDENS